VHVDTKQAREELINSRLLIHDVSKQSALEPDFHFGALDYMTHVIHQIPPRCWTLFALSP
jgi:hypothetical protein